MMTFGTLCSGIEAAAVAWSGLNWNQAFCAEIDPFCCSVLSHHYPEMENLGDVTEIEDAPKVDILVAGTPCQSFSIAGKREGLDSSNGRLALALPRLAISTAAQWIVWENVPGVLSSNRGRDFGAFLGGLADCGFQFAWRVLDAQHFGVAQRRRRVYVVANRGGIHPGAVLFERPEGESNAEALNRALRRRASLRTKARARRSLIGWRGDITPKHGIEITPTLCASPGGEGVGVIGRGVFRKLTPIEWERLQGFPDGYTDVEGCSDAKRRKALGNAFCVPVIKWIGERIDVVDSGENVQGAAG